MLKRLFASHKYPYIPGINRPEKVEIDLSGSTLTMLMPPHSNYQGFAGKEPPERVNIYDDKQYSDDSLLPDWQREGKSHLNLFSRRWELYGPPWRTRPYGNIQFGASISRYDALPEGMSSFNPNHFEQMAIRTLWFTGPAHPDLGRFCSPINWDLRNRESGSPWLYYEYQPDYSNDPEPPPEFMHTYRGGCLRTPLDDRYYLNMGYSYLGYAPVETCLKHMNALTSKVLRSVRLELGSTAKQRLAEAKRKWPDARATKHREPEPWIYPEWRRGDDRKGEDNVVILKPGSPPPVLTP
ncbi:hypothetical protein ACONUD_01205 [Microbulbifer harenosus]|uniref:DUF2169 domain-containing protein n=1 Tax=Microbulbifer harenosus TaxID=2576840 RepID=A0ABY2UNR0_9GAMM|nr:MULTISPECIES: hypothetical protein [Microbulbifer]QIL89854.1 hypothetical protein GNX18_08890 [Microbulbifer sp. SH-1]TLM79520.1 hypothetical protein FDY93_01195 [Microbulbifer harenosus]